MPYKNGKSRCVSCNKELSYYRPKKKNRCRACFKENPNSIIKEHHFKKGMVAWNKGIPYTEEMKVAQSERLKGIPMPKPEGFSDTMRKVNPPLGRKIKFDCRDKEKKLRVWRHGYIFVYKPDHPTSRKVPPDYGYIAEHRMIMELHLGRDLTSLEVIHHIDGDKSNNAIENLLCCETQKKHNRVHTKMEIFVEKLIREGSVYYDRETKEFRFR